MTSNGFPLPSAKGFRDFHELSPFTEPSVPAGTPIRVSRDSTSSDNALERVEGTDKKTYGIVRKIFEGLGLILLNAVTLGSVNLELLRGKNSWLMREYERVFLDAEITVIVSGGSSESYAAPIPPRPRSTDQSSGSDSDSIDPGAVDLTLVDDDTEQPPALQPNPMVGREFSIIIPTGIPHTPQQPHLPIASSSSNIPPPLGFGEGPAAGIQVSFTVLDMFVNVTGVPPETVLQDQPLRPAIEGPLGDRAVVPAQSSGFLSTIGSVLGSGWNYVTGAEEPRLEARARFLVVVDQVQHIIEISLNTPLAGNQTPMQMIMGSLDQQLPEELRGAAHRGIERQEGSHLAGTAQLEMIGDDEPQLLQPMVPQRAVMPGGDERRGPVGTAPIAALIASTALFEQALQEELHLMGGAPPAPTINPVNVYRGATPVLGVLGYLGRFPGVRERAAARLGFNPAILGFGIAGALMLGIAGRNRHNYQRQTVAQGHEVAVIAPGTQNQGVLSWIYNTLRNMVTSAVSTIMPNRTVQPIASAEFSQGDTHLRFDYLGRRNARGRGVNDFLFERYGIMPMTPQIIIGQEPDPFDRILE